MAELALAIIPLIVCTIENYSTVSKVVSRYRHFSDQADEFFGELDVQCKIFHTTVQLLLAPSVGDEQARRMMQDDNDAMWTDSDLDIYMTERFSGSNAPTVRNYLDLIQRQIAKLLEVGKSFGVVTEAVGRVSLLVVFFMIPGLTFEGREFVTQEIAATSWQEDQRRLLRTPYRRAAQDTQSSNKGLQSPGQANRASGREV